uniref:Uncharacterized protein n=1 Tax=Anguilla anguilla TaxID=7936 RepID=A0A0E9PFR9_ANGAN
MFLLKLSVICRNYTVFELFQIMI